MLDGENAGLAYSIPFSMVASITRLSESRCRVALRGSTTEIRLEDSADVTDRNEGVFILDGTKKTHVPWENIKKVEFTP
jgi:hypothetical protein